MELQSSRKSSREEKLSGKLGLRLTSFLALASLVWIVVWLYQGIFPQVTGKTKQEE